MKRLRAILVGVLMMSVIIPTVAVAKPMKLKANDQVTQTTETVKKAEFKMKDSQVEVGGKWQAENNFDSATDANGKKLAWKDISEKVEVSGKVDTNKIGTYDVTFTYNKIKQPVKVKVVEKKPVALLDLKEIKVKDMEIKVGQVLNPVTLFESAEKKDGTFATWEEIAKEVKIDNQINAEKVGTYTVTFTYGKLAATSKVSVVENKEVVVPLELKVFNSTVFVGGKWAPNMNFESIVLSNNQSLTWNDVVKDMVVVGNVDTEKVGEYPVTYTYGDITQTIIVTVQAEETLKVQEISVKDTTLQTGGKWKAEDNFNYVLMSDGTKRTFNEVEKELKVSGEVKSSVPGKYKVNYAYEDKIAVATVTVKDMEVVKVQEISVKDTNLPTGEKWKAEDNFNYVLMSDGTKKTFKEVEKELKVSGEVKSSVPGKYKVTYAYGDKTATATVTVKDMEVIKVQEIVLQNTEITVGSKWEPKDNFKQIKMSNGTSKTWKDVEKEIIVVGHTGVTGERVNTQKAGTYKVDYTYGGQTATATVTVKENKKTIVPVNPGKKLPQTGEVNQKGIIVLGLVIIIGIGTIVLKKMKREVE